LVRASHLDLMDLDILYHLALGSGSHDLRAMFGDVKVEFSNIHNYFFFFSFLKIKIWCLCYSRVHNVLHLLK